MQTQKKQHNDKKCRYDHNCFFVFRKLFWSDWDRAAPKLEWSNLDGSQREVFLQGNAVKLPNSLAIDFDRDELCWADAGTKSIGETGDAPRHSVLVYVDRS